MTLNVQILRCSRRLFIILVSLMMTCLFLLDAYMISCPTRSKNLGSTLIYTVQPDCSEGSEGDMRETQVPLYLITNFSWGNWPFKIQFELVLSSQNFARSPIGQTAHSFKIASSSRLQYFLIENLSFLAQTFSFRMKYSYLQIR